MLHNSGQELPIPYRCQAPWEDTDTDTDTDVADVDVDFDVDVNSVCVDFV